MSKILSKKDAINEAFTNYTDTLEKVNERRNEWSSKTKQELIDTLTLIKDTFKYDWQVQKLDGAVNNETINITINKSHSGITEKTADDRRPSIVSIKSYVKTGGYLAFCQSYNGKINVIVGLPSIEDIVTNINDALLIGTIEPADVTESLISDYVIKFLEKMREWEGQDRTPIGY